MFFEDLINEANGIIQNELKDYFVEFEKGKKTFDNYMDLKFFLEDLLDRQIDLVTRPALKPDLEATITRSILYASGL